MSHTQMIVGCVALWVAIGIFNAEVFRRYLNRVTPVADEIEGEAELWLFTVLLGPITLPSSVVYLFKGR